MLEFVFREHAGLAVDAALLFVVGGFLAWPVIHYGLSAAAWLPLALFRLVLRLIGPSPPVLRTAAVIFAFNGTFIFIDMASGFHPVLPKAMAIWTGLNVALVMGMAPADEGLRRLERPAPGRWTPPGWLTGLCGMLVLLLELPCFWFSIAMGIAMGHAVQGGAPYLEALAPRAEAYAAAILPVLFLSALAEAVAIRGSLARAEPTA